MPNLSTNERKGHARREETVFRKGNDLVVKLPRHDCRIAIVVQLNGALSLYNSHPDEKEYWLHSNADLRASGTRIYSPLSFMSGEQAIGNVRSESAASDDDERDIRTRTPSFGRSPRPVSQLFGTPRPTRCSTPLGRAPRSRSALSMARQILDRRSRPETPSPPQRRDSLMEPFQYSRARLSSDRSRSPSVDFDFGVTSQTFNAGYGSTLLPHALSPPPDPQPCVDLEEAAIQPSHSRDTRRPSPNGTDCDEDGTYQDLLFRMKSKRQRTCDTRR